jgi:thioredoxin-related protein
MQLLMATFILFMSFFAGADYTSPEAFEKETSRWKALVFLSEGCPCSRSHIVHLNELQEKYPELKIYGVISEPPKDEKEKKEVDGYFQNTVFKFPIIADDKQSLVKRYGALKTPHLTLFQKNAKGYEVVYEGGVTDQKDFAKSGVKYFAENMAEISQGKTPKYKNGQSMGCYIRRL